MKKAIAYITAFLLLLAALSGCGRSILPGVSESPDETLEPTPDSTLEPTPGPELSGDITVWNIWPNEEDPHAKAWNRAWAEFRTLYPDVTVNVESYENEMYENPVFPMGIASNTLPDVFFGWRYPYMRDLVANGMLEPLNGYLDDEYLSTVQPGSLDNFTIDGKIYGLTMSGWTAALYCNRRIFDENNIKIPKTYEELLTAVDAFYAAGVVPIALPAQDAWTVAFWQQILAIRYAGADNVNAMLRGEKSFDDPAIVQSAQALLDLAERGAFDPVCLSMGSADVGTRFAMGEYPMYYMGDWQAGTILGPMPDADGSPTGEFYPDKGYIVAVNFPATGNGFDDQILGGATDGFMVNANSANKAVAVEFVKFMTARMPEFAYETAGVIPTRSNFDMSRYSPALSPLTVDIADFASRATGAAPPWDTLLSDDTFLSDVPRDMMLMMLQQLVGQEITAEEFAVNMAQAMEDGC